MSSLGGRVLKGVVANGFGQGVTILIQLAAVPILFSQWGKQLYGEWLLLSTIPQYLLMSEFGFGQAAANDMAVSMGRDDRQATLRSFQSSWALITLASISVALIAALGIMFLPWTEWLKFEQLPRQNAVIASLLLVVQVIAAQQSTLFNAAYRCCGYYARGVVANNLARLAAFLVGIGAVLAGQGVIAFAFASAATQVVGTLIMGVDSKRLAPWLTVGFRHANMGEIRRLTVPALTFMALPMGHALNQQGIMTVIGLLFGPAAVAIFGPMRTLSRLIQQATTALGGPVLVELSHAFGRNDLDQAKRLHASLVQTALAVAGVLAILLAVFGEPIYTLFTAKQATIQTGPYLVLVLVGFINTFWSSSSNVPMAINKHQSLTVSFLICNAVALGVAWAVGTSGGLMGPALALLAVELAMSVRVIRDSLRLLQQPFGDFLTMMRRDPRRSLRELAASR